MHRPAALCIVEIREERQQNPVAHVVSALVAVTRPIINGVLQSISNEVIASVGRERETLPLLLLGKLRSEGDGDCGIAFEYAIHDAVARQEPVATGRIDDALKLCRISAGTPASILFAIEKAGAKQLISACPSTRSGDQVPRPSSARSLAGSEPCGAAPVSMRDAPRGTSVVLERPPLVARTSLGCGIRHGRPGGQPVPT